jgi:2,5-diketo-D-gluconate reductase B
MIYIDVAGVKIPALGYGTARFRDGGCQQAVETALETGYRHIDTARRYDIEDEVGHAIRASGLQREELFVTTKVWFDSCTEDGIRASLSASLKDLQTDYADLFLLHWPVMETPLSVQIKALRALQAEGLTKLIGVSNFTVAQMKEIREELGTDIVNNQVEYHPFLPAKKLLDYIRKNNMFLTAYSPLALGRAGEDSTLQDIGKKHGKSASQVTLRWMIQQDRVSCIPKSKTPERIRENFDIFDFNLNDGDMQRVNALSQQNMRLSNPDWSPEWDRD